jgi:vitamin B12 transporter
MVKKPQEKPYVYLNSMGGSHDTQQESLELGGKLNNFSYLFNIIRLDTKGISKAKEKNNNPENDPYQDTNIILGLNYSDVDTEAGLAIKGVHSRMELDDDDNVDGIPEDDLDNMSWNNEFFNTVYFTRTLNSYLKYRAQAGFTSIYRKNRDDNSSGTDEYTRSWYRGETYQAGNHFEFIPFDYYKLIGGFDYTKEKMDSYSYTFDYSYMFGYESDTPKTSMHTKGWFVEQVLTPQDKLEIDFSYRREKHPLFKYHSVVKGGAVYSLSQNLNLYFSYGEGFKAPSLYQLFSANGNSSLTPEKSKTWETGITHKLFDYLSYSASYFHSDFKNLIDFVYTNPSLYQGKYLNAAKAKARGVELKINIEPIKPLSLEAGYSYLNGKQDFVDDDYVTIFRHSSIRVPKHKAFLKGDWKIGNLTTHFDLLYVDKRTDRIWVGASDEFVTMKSYILGNLSFSYLLKNDIYLFANINNILDKDYERIKGYQEERTSFYAGVRCKF